MKNLCLLLKSGRRPGVDRRRPGVDQASTTRHSTLLFIKKTIGFISISWQNVALTLVFFPTCCSNPWKTKVSDSKVGVDQASTRRRPGVDHMIDCITKVIKNHWFYKHFLANCCSKVGVDQASTTQIFDDLVFVTFLKKTSGFISVSVQKLVLTNGFFSKCL